MALSSCLVESAHPLSRHSQHRHSAVERNILKIERMHLQGSLRYVPKLNWVYFNYPCCQLTLATVFYVQKHVWLIIVQSCIKATVYHAQDSLRTVSCLHKIFNDIDRLWIWTPYLQVYLIFVSIFEGLMLCHEFSLWKYQGVLAQRSQIYCDLLARHWKKDYL